MAKKTTTTAVATKTSKGGGKIDEQISKLRSKLSKVEVARAEEVIADVANHGWLTLAWKLMPKASTRALVLSKRELATKAQIVAAAGQQAADKWAESILAQKSEKKSKG